MSSGSFRSSLEIDRVSKRYGTVAALDGVSLTVGAGEFLTLLGPSGSGKTTLLMAIAGFVAPSGGTIRLDGTPILPLPPERRNFGMVFQGYALFPHMSVAKNVAFPLEVRGRPKAEVERAVRDTLALVRLGHLAERLPRQLSGGQQQRVALARALVFEPHLLLLDEPLSALDRKLRLEVQIELKTLHREVGRTFIYVTHDQDEALSMSDRIAIMRNGHIVQVGAPADLYERPRTRYVADFLGRSNFVTGHVEATSGGEVALATGPWRIVQRLRDGEAAPSGDATLALRPERVRLLRSGDEAANRLTGTVASWSYFGTLYHLVVDVDGLGPIALSAPAAEGPPPGIGDSVAIGWAGDAGTIVIDDSAPPALAKAA